MHNYVKLVHLQVFVTTEDQFFNSKWSPLKLELEKTWIAYQDVNHAVKLVTVCYVQHVANST